MNLSFFKRKKEDTTKRESRKKIKEDIIKKIQHIESSKNITEKLIEDLYDLVLLTTRVYTKNKNLTLTEIKPYLKEKKWLLLLIEEVVEYKYSTQVPTKEEIHTLTSNIKKHL